MLLIYLAAASATASVPMADIDFMKATNRWQDCVIEKVRGWASGSDQPSVLVQAALDGCDRETFTAQQATIRASSDKKPRDAIAYVNAWLTGSERGIRSSATAIILDARAKLLK